jgi:hypothetical protein
VAIPGTGSELPFAQRIAAESPQDLHGQIRGLGAESLFFGALRQKCARKQLVPIIWVLEELKSGGGFLYYKS